MSEQPAHEAENFFDDLCAKVLIMVDNHNAMDTLGPRRGELIRVLVALLIYEVGCCEDEKKLDTLMEDAINEIVSRLPQPRPDVDSWS
jgi:hypothetical protein